MSLRRSHWQDRRGPLVVAWFAEFGLKLDEFGLEAADLRMKLRVLDGHSDQFVVDVVAESAGALRQFLI